jgi:HD-like signal output (HDOD) protein
MDVIQANIEQGHLSIGGGLLRRWGFDDIFIKVVTMYEGRELTPDIRTLLACVILTTDLSKA